MREKHFPKRPGGLNIHEKDLRQRFTSYHLKSVFLTLTIGNYEKNDIRGWLVLLLKEIIVCLQKKSIKHHFIDGLELLAYPSEKGSFSSLEVTNIPVMSILMKRIFFHQELGKIANI